MFRACGLRFRDGVDRQALRHDVVPKISGGCLTLPKSRGRSEGEER